MRAPGVALLATLAVATGVAAHTDGADAATRTVTISGWANQVAAFSGRTVLVSEAATVRVNPRAIAGSPAGATPFTYYRAELKSAELNRARTRFTGAPATVTAVRTSIGAMSPGVLTPAGGGDYVMAPVARGFATPVVWCCTDGDAVVTESDSRTDAPRITAAGADGTGRVRMLLARPGGGMALVGVDPVGLGVNRTETPVAVATIPALASMAGDVLTWVDPAVPDVLHRASVSDVGIGPDAAVSLPGRAVAVWSAAGIVAAAVRIDGRVRVVRVDGAAKRPRAVWNGARVPKVAVGAGTLVLADGRRILAASGTRPLRRIARAGGRVAAVAADGTRIAWLQRMTRKGQRVTVVRLEAVPR